MKIHLLCEWTSRQCNQYQAQGSDVALVPVGSVEVLEPHLPIGGAAGVG
jgi:creatinine amidohydrolase/Fe(II)-dependent formamide hydrolase-like protein